MEWIQLHQLKKLTKPYFKSTQPKMIDQLIGNLTSQLDDTNGPNQSLHL